MLFGRTIVRGDHLVIPSYMVPLLMISGHYLPTTENLMVQRAFGLR